MSTVIKIENLYKEYRLGVIGHGTLYRDMQSWWAKIRGKDDPNSLITSNLTCAAESRILALKNINLDIEEGEVIGIIGANGAGKSTLLKILSRVTAPTKGTIKVKGRIASLLEVGTGFHPELTGRENIYLNGAINGMNKREVKKALDQIVDFAGVENYLDTPVKRYSSGMHVRLGFAVAAHLESEILVVDEVLAVGDAEFQKKAIGKMKDITGKAGRTVLFVSHNMQSIRELCRTSILVNKGKIELQGESNEIVGKYLKGVNTSSVKKLLDSSDFRRDKQVDGTVQFTDFEICDLKGNKREAFHHGEIVCIHFAFTVNKDRECLYLESDILSNTSGHILSSMNHCISDKLLKKGYKAKVVLKLDTSSILFGEFPMHFLLHGKGMYEDYDFLSKTNVPPLYVLNENGAGKNVQSLFHTKSELIVEKV